MKKRFDIKEIEQLSPLPFIFFAGAIWGVLQALPEFFAHGGAATGLLIRIAAFGLGVPLWWAAIRRRRWSVWIAALHATIALDLAHLIGFALSLGGFTAGLDRAGIPSFLMQATQTAIVLSPIRFLIALPVIAIGRLLPGSGRTVPIQVHSSAE